MFYHYSTILDEIEVVHTPLENGHTLVRVEKPDEVYGFKSAECLIPSYKVSNVVGFTDEELVMFVQFCKNNAHLLLKYAEEGGIANA